MDKQTATNLITQTFDAMFDEQHFANFARNLFNQIDESKAFSQQGAYIWDAFKGHVRQYKRLGTYTDPEGTEIDVLIVRLKKETALDRARTMQRNFVARYLKGRDEKDAALVAYYSDDQPDWRFSLVKMEYQIAISETTGRLKTEEVLTPARRYSFLVGQNEPNHTAQQQLVPILQETRHNPTLAQLEAAFNIESVTKEFFQKYKNLFLDLKDELDRLAGKNKAVKSEFDRAGIDTTNFAKKLLGQIVFLYFLQKKGWLGVAQGQAWGSGPKDFLRRLFKDGESELTGIENLSALKYTNFFNDVLEPLFYEALAIERPGNLYPRLNCRIPFLNGGLFEPVGDYDWRGVDILLDNSRFRDIFETFDLFNFTVREDEPLEKEVAVDPEMLGKVFENLLDVTDRKSKGAFYTPREIVHYMCQESLINYLDTSLNSISDLTGFENLSGLGPTAKQQKLFGDPDPEQLSLQTASLPLGGTEGGQTIPRADIDALIRQGEFGLEHDAAKAGGTKSYQYQLPPAIRDNAAAIDDALANIKICDPAIGSGAFPVGLMQEVVKARTVLTTYLTPPPNPLPDIREGESSPSDVGGTKGGNQSPSEVGGTKGGNQSPSEVGGTKGGNQSPSDVGGTKGGNQSPSEVGGTKGGNQSPSEVGGIKGGNQSPSDVEGTKGGKQWQTPPELWAKLKPLARQMRREPTPAENKLWQRLRNKQILNHKFRRQHTIDRFIVDFYCRQARLVIEVDGPTHDYTIEEDAIRQEFLESQNLRVIRFTNADVLHNIGGVLQKIVEVISTPPPNPLPDIREGESSPSEVGGIKGGNQSPSEVGGTKGGNQSPSEVGGTKGGNQSPSEVGGTKGGNQSPSDVGGTKGGNQSPSDVGGTKGGNQSPSEVGGTKGGNQSPSEIGGIKGGRTPYQFKRHAIQESIYGVDIDPGAVDIAKLRLWLSLVVDEESYDTIQPLPNLDYKIVCGNALLGVEKDLFNRHLFEEIEQLKPQYFAATDPTHKRTLKSRIDDLIAQLTHSTGSGQAHGNTQFDFEIYFSEVFHHNGGFDVVIGNPPYVRQEDIGPQKATLVKNHKDAATGKSDLYVYFYVRGIQILREGGVHTFICSNSWLDVGYGAKLQEYLLNNATVQAIYHSEVERDFATAEVNTIISVIQKLKPQSETTTRFVTFKAPIHQAIQNDSLRREVSRTRAELWNEGLQNNRYKGDKWGAKYLRAPNIYWTIFNASLGKFVQLGEVATIQRGYTTGANKFFYFNDEAIYEWKIEKEFLYWHLDTPRNSYGIPVANENCIKLFICDYPKAKLKGTNALKYIIWGEKQGHHKKSTCKSRNLWYSLKHRPFPRASWPRTFFERHICYDMPEQTYCSDRFYGLSGNKFTDTTLACLNSTYASLLVEVSGYQVNHGGIDTSVWWLKTLPVFQSQNAELEQVYAKLKQRDIELARLELELSDRRELDELIFEMLGLSPLLVDDLYASVKAMIENRIHKSDRELTKKA